MRQIDLEEVIASHPMTVREYAAKHGEPEWRVRKSIALGTLEVDDRKRPMLIKDGEMALTVQEWQRAIEPAARKIKPSVCSWSDGGKQFNVLGLDNRVRSFRITLTSHSAGIQRREIDDLPCKRVEAAA